jgi:hypothetical protein
MTVAISTLQLALYNWVTGVTGVTTIWSFANAPQPALPYITLNILNINTTGPDYETPPNDDGDAALFGDRELTLEVNYYGNGGIDALENLRTSIQQFDIKQTLNAAGIVFIDRELSENLTFLQDSLYEERHLMEFRFRYSNQGVGNANLFEVGIIEHVGMEGEFDKGDGTVVITQTYDIDSTP